MAKQHFFIDYKTVAIIFIHQEGMVSKKSINKKMIDFTNKIKSLEEIRLFAGDLSFLGNVKDGSIEKNHQYLQLKDLCDNNACEIKIICHKPKDNDFKKRQLIFDIK